jgi:hypothetical protein
MDIYGQHRSNDNYKVVLDEILNGNSFLLLPSANSGVGENDWTNPETGVTLTLKSVFNLDGLKVLGAFTDEYALLHWTKKETQYTGMRTQAVLEFCQKHSIDRIVINSDQKNMYVLERNRQHFKAMTVEEDTKVSIGMPANPLKKHIIDRLVENFKNVDTIEEAYQFAQNRNGNISIVLGVKLSVVSDNSRAALLNAITNSIGNEKTDLPVDIFVLETEAWLSTARKVENALFYKRK